ncbi:hypothetical protein GQ53DRAFT_840505 [Thozetella sp. PMI_491]|nr:hypothetical protein GQ53DRAFT_840505 [Thozetella sp. PMI_491]
MAAASYYSGAPMGDEVTDMGALWEQAINDYYHESGGTDLRGSDSSRWNMGRILGEQEEQLQLFGQFRHDKGRVDKLRTLVSKNSAIIQNVATYVANAASTAFPPSAAILTAFNYVMSASKAVSEDYDMVVQFFDIMNSFLERIAMLENRMPDLKQFQVFLMNVFKSLLTLAAIARKYRTEQGRLKKWAKALVEKNDKSLTGAFDSLHLHLQRFEQATMIATLRVTIDTSRKVDSYGKEFKAIQSGVNQAVELGQQGLIVGQQNLAQGQMIYALGEEAIAVAVDGKQHAMEAAFRAQEILDVVNRQDGNEQEQNAAMKRIERKIERMRTPQQRGKAGTDQNMDGGARRSTAMRMFQAMVYPSDDWKELLTEIETSHVHGTFQWLRDEMFFQDLEGGTVPIVWICGAPGMGKSSLVYSMQRALREEFEGESDVSVACAFFSQDQEDYGSAAIALRAMSFQVAQQDVRYREEVLADLQHDGVTYYREPTLKMWKRLFLSKFGKQGHRRVVLLFDGVDEASEESRKELVKLVNSFHKSETNIQMVFTSEPGFLDSIKAPVVRFELNKKRLEKDMKIIVTARMKQLSILRKLRSRTKGKITRRICEKADNIRYIDHMMRRLNSIGREAPIMKELESLPKDTKALYKLMLDDCARPRTEEDRKVLRIFFAWLAYTKEPLNMAEATQLLKHIDESNRLNVDDEVEHRSALVLRLSNVTWGDDERDSDVSDKESEKGDNDKDRDDEGSSEDWTIFLGFQERSLRQFFCQKETEEIGLRSSPTQGHAMIFSSIASILTSTPFPKSFFVWNNVDLARYASSHWIAHLFEIKIDELGDDEAAKVIEGIYALLSNRNNALKAFERFGGDSVFGEDSEKTLETLKAWASRAIHLPASKLSPGTAEWMRPLIRNPDIIHIRLAEGHVNNWFMYHGEDDIATRCSFLFAHNALKNGQALLKQQPELRDYFEKREKDADVDITPDSITIVSKSFWQMQMTMTSQCYRAIGMALKWYDHFEASIDHFQTALETADDDEKEKLLVYCKMGQALYELAAKQVETAEKETKEREKEGSKEEAGNKPDAEGEKPTNEPAKPPKNWVEIACETLRTAAELIPQISYSEEEEEDAELKRAIVIIHVTRAKAELLNGSSDNLISYIEEANKIPLQNRPMDTSGIIENLAKLSQWSRIIDMTRVMKDDDANLQWVWAWNYNEVGIHLQRAGKETGETEQVIKTYENGLRTILTWGAPASYSANIIMPLATFYRTVIRGPDSFKRAKELLRKVLSVSNESDQLSEASFYVADILVEEFRSTRDPNKKMMAQSEMKALVAKMRENIQEFDWTQSQTTIPLAYMTRKLAAVEFQKGLEATFQGCLGLLTDATVGNDSQSLRILARVLAYVPGLDRDSRIAATCQLYILDMELHKKEDEQRVSDAEDDEDDSEEMEKKEDDITEKSEDPDVNGTKMNGIETNGAEANGAVTNGVETNGTTEAKDGAAKATETGDEKPEAANGAANEPEASKETEANGEKKEEDANEEPTYPDEDYDDLHGKITCNNCREEIKDWHHGSVYMCYYCTELTLCEKCYHEKLARESGELPPDWRTLCPVGHKHIKAPVEGWKGLKDGIMKFETEEVKFDVWLLELKQKKWTEAWERFWSEEMRE